MIMETPTLAQLEVFLAVVEAGSFSAAARALGRAQSAVTYSIQKLEEEAGVELFDRSAYRPTLSDAGRTLLPRAQRIVDDVAVFRSQARGMAGGLEPEISLVVEAMFPMCLLLQALTDFQAKFPTVETRVRVETMGAAVEALLDGAADIGLVVNFADRMDELVGSQVTEVELVAVASPTHALAGVDGPLDDDALSEHLQLVLTDRSDLTRGRDKGVVALRTWRLADLGAKHAMLLAGLGWGSMPRHMVAEDIAAGRLVELRALRWDGRDGMPRLPVVAVRRKAVTLGPAGAWLLERLSEGLEEDDLPVATVRLASGRPGG
jgi:DNA-binding transcriptional LysR family regulator